MNILRNKNAIALAILGILLAIAFFHSCASTSVNTSPTDGWKISSPEDQGIRSQTLAEMIKEIDRTGLNIDSVLIVRNGFLVFDAYFWPFLEGQKHIIHSCTKSIMSSLIGIAIDKGYIHNVNQPILDFLPDRQFANMDDLKKSITLKNLLTMASGLKWGDSDLYEVWEMRRSDDWAQYVLDSPIAAAPGETFEYCSGASYLLSVIIQNTTKMKTLEFARKHLFDPLGITDIGWEESPQGVNVGYGEMWLRPHDMAKFGWLYLNKGRWGRRQILRSAWVEASTRRQIDATPLFDQYGYQWWVDSDGYYVAAGYGGQYIFVLPDRDMVVVFTSDLALINSPFPKRLLEEYIIPAAISSEPLPSNPAGKARLDDLLTGISRAPSKGYIWASEAEGMAKDGVFERTSSPSFKFEYPLGSKKTALESPNQVMGMKIPGEVFLDAAVGDIPYGIELEDFGPKYYVRELSSIGSHVKVTLNEEITLKCGTKAYRTHITWLYDDTIPITTSFVSAYKDGKFVSVFVHAGKNYDGVDPIVRSLTLK